MRKNTNLNFTALHYNFWSAQKTNWNNFGTIFNYSSIISTIFLQTKRSVYILHNNIPGKKILFYNDTVCILRWCHPRTNSRRIEKFSNTKKGYFPDLHCSTYWINVNRFWTMFLYWEQFSITWKNSLFQKIYFLKRDSFQVHQLPMVKDRFLV